MSKAEKPSVFKSLLDRRKQIEAEPELVEELEETLPIAQVESDEVKEPPPQPEGLCRKYFLVTNEVSRSRSVKR